MFDDPEPPTLSREWIEELANSANSTGGIQLTAEHIEGEQPGLRDHAPQTVAVHENRSGASEGRARELEAVMG